MTSTLSSAALSSLNNLKLQGIVDLYNKIAAATNSAPYSGKKTKTDAAIPALQVLLTSHDLVLANDLSDVYRATGSSLFSITQEEVDEAVAEIQPVPELPAPTMLELKAATADVKRWSRPPLNMSHDRIREVSMEVIAEQTPRFLSGFINAEDLEELRGAHATIAVLTAEATESVKATRAAPFPKTEMFYRLVDENPKKPGSASHARFQKAWGGYTRRTMKDLLDLGYTRGDLAWDLDRGFVTNVAPQE